MLKPKTYLIFNPSSAWGKTRLRYKEILSAFQRVYGCDFVPLETARPLEAISLSRNAIKDNAELIVCVGGDGTINEVVNGFYSDCALINTNCRLGIISSGTGHGFAQSMGIPENFEEQVLRIKYGPLVKIDVGKATFNNLEGGIEHRFFVNELQAGIGGAVVKNAETKSKLLGGLFAFGYTTIKASFTYPNQKITISVNGKKEITKSIMGIVFANGQYTGGGMNLVPSAKPFDGLLDIMIMHNQTRKERLINFSKIYSGTHIKSKKFEVLKGTYAEITSDEKVLLEADGELLGTLPCKVELLPSQIKVC